MTNHQFVTVTRTLLKRGVTDLERKLVACASTGAAGYFVLTILHAYNVHLPSAVEELVPYSFALIGGYIAHSAGSVTTVTNPAPVAAPDGYDESLAAAVRRLNEQQQTVITGPTAAPHESRPQTGAIPVQQSFPEPVPVPDPTPAHDPAPQPYEVPDHTPTRAELQSMPLDELKAYQESQAFTQVIAPEQERAQSFLERRAAMRYPYTPTDEPVGN